MDLSLSPAEEEFRDELRGWIEANHPGPTPDGDEAGFEHRVAWQRKLNERGWAGLTWPTEYGGGGATLIEQSIFYEEMARARAPRTANVLGLTMGGPVVIAHGSEQQKERYLAPILSADEIWCQGFSEPESGSDLASLKTRAVRDGDDWVVTGQKVWTTLGHRAKWCMLVARTNPDAPKHRGLTYFLMDMEQDAVETRPLVQITGEPEFNELFIEEARIPNENVVGEVDGGWAVAITTLAHERAGLAMALQVEVQIAMSELVEEAKAEGFGKDPVVRDRIAQLLHRGAGAAPQRLPRHHRPDEARLPRSRGLAGQVALGGDQPGADLAGAGHPRPGRARDGRHLGLPLPALEGQLDRGRHHRDPQEHRRRARPGTAPRMNFDLSDDQRDIQRSAKEMLASRYKLEEVRRLALEEERGFTDAQWSEMAELGWPDLLDDLGMVELSVIAEELGYALAPTPLQSHWAAKMVADFEGRGTVGVPRRRQLAHPLPGLRRRRRARREGGGRRHRRASRGAGSDPAAVPGDGGRRRA